MPGGKSPHCMVVLPICKTEMIILTSLHRTESKEQKLLYKPNSDSTTRDGRTHVNLIGQNQPLEVLST